MKKIFTGNLPNGWLIEATSSTASGCTVRIHANSVTVAEGSAELMYCAGHNIIVPGSLYVTHYIATAPEARTKIDAVLLAKTIADTKYITAIQKEAAIAEAIRQKKITEEANEAVLR